MERLMMVSASKLQEQRTSSCAESPRGQFIIFDLFVGEEENEVKSFFFEKMRGTQKAIREHLIATRVDGREKVRGPSSIQSHQAPEASRDRERERVYGFEMD